MDNTTGIEYAVCEQPDRYQLFGSDHLSIGFETWDYIQDHNIPVVSSHMQRRWFRTRWGARS